MRETSAPQAPSQHSLYNLASYGKITRNKKVVIKLLKKNIKFLLKFEI